MVEDPVDSLRALVVVGGEGGEVGPVALWRTRGGVCTALADCCPLSPPCVHGGHS